MAPANTCGLNTCIYIPHTKVNKTSQQTGVLLWLFNYSSNDSFIYTTIHTGILRQKNLASSDTSFLNKALMTMIVKENGGGGCSKGKCHVC